MYLVLCLFQACSAGLTGNNCSIPCRYPSFGHFCQSKCNCNNSSCNAVTGCIGKFKYTLSFVWYNYSNALFLSLFQQTLYFMLKRYYLKIICSCCFIQYRIHAHVFFHELFSFSGLSNVIPCFKIVTSRGVISFPW